MKIVKDFSALEHLNNLVNDVQSLIDKKEDFIAFIIIALGIEFLGSFYDSKSFDDYGESDTRFKNGMKLFKNNWYKNNSSWLYKQLRGPLIHQYRTGPEIYLTSNCKNNVPPDKHFIVENSKKVFVLEQFFEDFKYAVNQLKSQLKKPNNSLNKNKPMQSHLGIVELNGLGTTAASGIIWDLKK
ncbi:MAG TPA: hypothetical protein VIM89_09670 [Mucilaginibacter sp.]